MSFLDLPGISRLEEWLETVRRGTPKERAVAVDHLLRKVITALPQAKQTTLIANVKWSNSFVTNDRWRQVWRDLGVATLGDLAQMGKELASTKGVGQGKLVALVQDLLDLATHQDGILGAAAGDKRLVENLKRVLAEIEQGPPSPAPHRAGAMMRALVASLSAEVRSLSIDGVPWSNEWCYTTGVWKQLGATTVADLGQLGASLANSKGIGRGKVLSIAHDLLALCPTLDGRVRTRASAHSRPPVGQARSPLNGNPRGNVVKLIDRFALSLSDRERDILRRRVGWRYRLSPETLKVLAEHHGVSHERIRQVEVQVRKRLERLVRLTGLPDLLHEALIQAGGQAELDSIVACSPGPLQGIMEVWRPLASVLAAEGGPYLIEDGPRVIVSGVAPRARGSIRQPGHDGRLNLEKPARWPRTVPHSLC
jgi:hypothetical protein